MIGCNLGSQIAEVVMEISCTAATRVLCWSHEKFCHTCVCMCNDLCDVCVCVMICVMCVCNDLCDVCVCNDLCDVCV